MLPLPQVQKGHHGCLFVLGRIAFQDLIYELVVLLRELEGNTSIVLGSVSMLELKLSVAAALLLRSSKQKGDSRHGGRRSQLAG